MRMQPAILHIPHLPMARCILMHRPHKPTKINTYTHLPNSNMLTRSLDPNNEYLRSLGGQDRSKTKSILTSAPSRALPSAPLALESPSREAEGSGDLRITIFPLNLHHHIHFHKYTYHLPVPSSLPPNDLHLNFVDTRSLDSDQAPMSNAVLCSTSTVNFPNIS